MPFLSNIDHRRFFVKKATVAIMTSYFAPNFAPSARANEFYIIRDLTTQKCSVVDKRPITNLTTITLADDSIYKSRIDAEAALTKIKVCTAQK
jgi:hypothetical protein